MELETIGGELMNAVSPAIRHVASHILVPEAVA
jgi:hypothetical protein